MEPTKRPLSELTSEVVKAALYAAFLSAAERAKQTNTYLVVMENDQIRKIPASEIDSYMSKH